MLQRYIQWTHSVTEKNNEQTKDKKSESGIKTGAYETKISWNKDLEKYFAHNAKEGLKIFIQKDYYLSSSKVRKQNS